MHDHDSPAHRRIRIILWAVIILSLYTVAVSRGPNLEGMTPEQVRLALNYRPATP
jgi:hypothetical protein